jgi:hypothetical protein
MNFKPFGGWWLVPVAFLYSGLIAFAEVSFGSLTFPMTLWSFREIPAYSWSVPVHAAGFAVLVLTNRLSFRKPLYAPVLASLSFFFIAELANLAFFKYFEYTQLKPLGPYPAFLAVILLYASLCWFCSLLLRKIMAPI